MIAVLNPLASMDTVPKYPLLTPQAVGLQVFTFLTTSIHIVLPGFNMRNNISVNEQDDRFQTENTTLSQGFNRNSFNLYFNNVQFFLECPLFEQQSTTLSEVIPKAQ